MININKYNTLKDYLESDNIVSDECRVSQIGPSANMSIIYDMPSALSMNRVLMASQLSKDDVAVVVKDKIDGKIKFIPERFFDMGTLDQSMYELKPWVRYRGEGKLQLMIHKSNAASVTIAGNTTTQWGLPQYCTFKPDLTKAGSWAVAVTVNGTSRSDTLTWAANASLTSVRDSLRTILNAGTGTNYNIHGGGCCVVSSGDHLNIAVGTYSNSGLTFTHTDGFDDASEFEDLSKYLMYNGVDYSSNARHGWQNQYLQNLLPSAVLTELRAAYGVASSGNIYSQTNYCRHGENLVYAAGANLTKSVGYATNSGSAPDNVNMTTAFSSSYGLKKSVFDSWALGVDTFGDYNGYMTARMMDVDRDAGVNALSKNNGEAVTRILGNVLTKDFSGNWVNAFPAAAAAMAVTDADLCPDGAALPTAHQIGCFMCDVAPNRYTSINSAIDKLGGGNRLDYGTSCWSSVEYSSRYAWCYLGSRGTLDVYTYKYYSFTVRPALAFSV